MKRTLSPRVISGRSRLECLDATDNFHDLPSDLGLPSPVVSPGQHFDHVGGIFRRAFHGDHSGDLFADGRVEKTFEQFDFETCRDDFFQDAGGRGNELVERLQGLGVGLCARLADVQFSQRQQRFHNGFLFGTGDKSRVSHIQAIEFSSDEFFQVTAGDLIDLFEFGLVVKLSVGLGQIELSKFQSGDSAFAGDFDLRRLLGEGIEVLFPLNGLAKNVSVVATAQSAVGGQNKQGGLPGRFPGLEQGVGDFQPGANQVTNQLGDPPSVVGRRSSSFHCFFETGRRDQFHRPRNLADIPNRLASFIKGSGIGHEKWGSGRGPAN